ncbi:hypothetical protein BU25DRAFT_414254, partial [Macroventuria anomochaeta]
MQKRLRASPPPIPLISNDHGIATPNYDQGHQTYLLPVSKPCTTHALPHFTASRTSTMSDRDSPKTTLPARVRSERILGRISL